MSSTRSRVGKGALGLLVLLVLGLAYAYGGRLFNNGRASTIALTGTIEATQVDVSAKFLKQLD